MTTPTAPSPDGDGYDEVPPQGRAYPPAPQTALGAKKKRRKWPWIVLAVVVVIISAGVAGNAGKKDQTSAATESAATSVASVVQSPTTAASEPAPATQAPTTQAAPPIVPTVMEAPTSAAVSAAPEPPSSTAAAGRVIDAQGAPQRIAAGFSPSGNLALTGRSAAVKSNDLNEVYFVAVEFSGTGMDPQIGVWATNDLNAGTIMSVDGTARAFTDWLDGATTDAKLSMRDDGATEAKDALS